MGFEGACSWHELSQMWFPRIWRYFQPASQPLKWNRVETKANWHKASSCHQDLSASIVGGSGFVPADVHHYSSCKIWGLLRQWYQMEPFFWFNADTEIMKLKHCDTDILAIIVAVKLFAVISQMWSLNTRYPTVWITQALYVQINRYCVRTLRF